MKFFLNLTLPNLTFGSRTEMDIPWLDTLPPELIYLILRALVVIKKLDRRSMRYCNLRDFINGDNEHSYEKIIGIIYNLSATCHKWLKFIRSDESLIPMVYHGPRANRIKTPLYKCPLTNVFNDDTFTIEQKFFGYKKYLVSIFFNYKNFYEYERKDIII